jgi:hypothetical protein
VILSTTTDLLTKYAGAPVGFIGSLSGDIGILALLFIAFVGLSYYFGRGFIVSVVLAFYPATILYKMFPFVEKLTFLSGNLVTLNKIGIFLLFLIPLTIIINRFIFTASDFSGGENILKLAGLSAAFLILIVLFSYNLVNYDGYHDFGTQIDNLFGSPTRQFYWFLAPLAILAII